MLLLIWVLLAPGCGESTNHQTVAGSSDNTASPDSQMEIQEAQAAISAFAAALKAELTSAMQQGGPLKAIEVCHTNARTVSENVSAEKGLQLSRVSLRNRNPQNAPENWQIPILESFEQRRVAGENPNALDWSEIVEVNGISRFRYVKAIPTGGMCLQCHGTRISPEVSTALQSLYPEDKATGFSEGDIRGAFVVTQP